MSKLAHDNLNDPVSAHARRDYTTLRDGQTVGEALESLRSQSLAEKIIYFYVIDPGGKLVGVVPTRRLLMGGPEAKLADLMVRQVVSIPDTMTVLDACEFFVLYRLLAFPVVDADERLVGVVDVGLFTDEIFDVSERQTRQDVFQLIGIHVALGRRESAWAGFKNRFPWLLCNIAGGIACAFVAARYEKFLNSVIVLALFIPVVLTLAEGVSIQSMTITLQGFREERTDWGTIFRSLRVEMMTALMLGAACGALVAGVAWAWQRRGPVALAIGLSICAAVLTACLLGLILPAMVRAVKGDPKIAAGPVVLAAADVATLLFYFNLSAIILG